MQCIGRRVLIMHHGDADIVRAGIETVRLVARDIAARQDAHAAFAPQLHRRRFAAADMGDVEPQKEAARRALVAVTIADDLIGKIEFECVKAAIIFHMRFVRIGGDTDLLVRHRHLWRGDIAQIEEGLQETGVAGGEADAQSRQIGALRQ